MLYVALLRGVNVGGRNKVEMKRLKAVFEHAGMSDVSTYINSGNVIFSSPDRARTCLTMSLEKAIEHHLRFNVDVLLRDLTAS